MTISRRKFCGVVGASLAAANSNLFADDSEPKPLRVIAYNIYKCTGWPSDRPLAEQAVAKGQMAERLAMELALHEPDIINFSESPSEVLTKEVAELLGMNHVRFPSGGNWPGTLLSKFEILKSQNAPTKGERPKELFTRHWGRAEVKLLGDNPLIVHPVMRKWTRFRLLHRRWSPESMRCMAGIGAIAKACDPFGDRRLSLAIRDCRSDRSTASIFPVPGGLAARASKVRHGPVEHHA